MEIIKQDEYGNTSVEVVAIIRPLFVTLLLLTVLFGTVRIVGAGSVGVVTRFGAVNRVAQPGLLVKIPFIEGVKIMETRTQKIQTPAAAASKDLQTVSSEIALNYHLDGARAVDVYQEVGVDYRERVIDPSIQEAFKAATAKFTANDLIVQRESVKVLVFDEVKERLSKYNIVADDFNIVNFDFSSEFNQAIESRQVAQQNLERAKTEAETARTQAKGQSDAQAILRESGSLSSEYLQYYALQKWNGILPQATSGVPFIQLPTP